MNRIQRIALFLAICCFLPSFVSAHPGGTDANGGHVDTDTGQYHYHHGYPAHDHYDMDKDGIIDCPYNFEDLSGFNSGSSSAGGSTVDEYDYERDFYYDFRPKETEIVTETVYVDREVIKEVPYTPVWIQCCLAVVLLLLFFSLVSNRCKALRISELEEDINAQIRKHKEEISKKEQHCLTCEAAYRSEIEDGRTIYAQALQRYLPHIEELECELKRLGDVDETNRLLREANRSLHEELLTTQTENKQFNIQFTENPAEIQESFFFNTSTPPVPPVLSALNIPPDIYFINGATPVLGKISKDKPFGDFTVYVAQNGRCYHRDRFCGTGLLFPEHAYEVIGKLRPCKNCASYYQESIPKWYRHLTALLSEKDISF